MWRRMFNLAEYLPPFPNATWTLARQAGVTHAVSQVPPDDVDGPGGEFLPLLRMKTRFADAGLTLEVIETGFPWLHAAKLGLPGADEEIERCCTLIRNLGADLDDDARSRRRAGHLVRPRADAECSIHARRRGE
jgi:D-mannonate dehydratase